MRAKSHRVVASGRISWGEGPGRVVVLADRPCGSSRGGGGRMATRGRAFPAVRVFS